MKKNHFYLNICGALFLLSGTSYAADVPFTYSGDNSSGSWGEHIPEWGTCSGASADALQSPINIRNTVTDTELQPLSIITKPIKINIFNNGHTIEQKYEGSGSNIYFEGIEYELKQFHFHTLSEHTIKQKRGVLEMHAVFNEPINNKNLVVSIIYKQGKNTNTFIQKIIDTGLPKKDGDIIKSKTRVNLKNGLTNTAAYYTYSGSLTTPPCTENVTWIVLKENASLSKKQLTLFRKILGNNFRPLQKRKGRTIRSTI